jgi:hypothetical protein
MCNGIRCLLQRQEEILMFFLLAIINLSIYAFVQELFHLLFVIFETEWKMAG